MFTYYTIQLIYARSFLSGKEEELLSNGREHFTKPTSRRLTFCGSPLLGLQVTEALKKGSKNDLFLHYIFMDNAFELPTGLGLPLQVSSSGVLAPGIQAGVKLEVKNVRVCSPSDSSGCSFPTGVVPLCNFQMCFQFKVKCLISVITTFMFMKNFRVPPR